MENETFAIIQFLIKGFNATDRKDYALRRSLWADEVTIDFGGVKDAQIMKADELNDWAKVAYQHMTTMHINFNHEITVEVDKATSYSYGRALHKQQVSKGENYWNIYATYEHELVKENGVWKVSRIKMTPIFQEGNTNLVNQAYEDALQDEKKDNS